MMHPAQDEQRGEREEEEHNDGAHNSMLVKEMTHGTTLNML
jgi:hypothetical protein